MRPYIGWRDRKNSTAIVDPRYISTLRHRDDSAPGGLPRALRCSPAEADPSAARRAVRPEPLVDHLRQLLLEDIISGDLEPGSSLNQLALTEELAVSRTPLREALQRLVGERFIDKQPDRGFFVPPLDPREGRELYESVGMLEASSFRRQAPLSRADLRDLRSLTERRRDSIGRPRESLELDRTWHDRLLAGVENRLILRRLETLKKRLLRYELAFQHDDDRVRVAIEQHRMMEDAVAEGESDEVPGILRRHWEQGKQLVRTQLENGSGGE